jgi:hypothetical protein
MEKDRLTELVNRLRLTSFETSDAMFLDLYALALGPEGKEVAMRLQKTIGDHLEQEKREDEDKRKKIVDNTIPPPPAYEGSDMLSKSLAILNWMRIDPVFFAQDIYDTLGFIMNHLYSVQAVRKFDNKNFRTESQLC